MPIPINPRLPQPVDTAHPAQPDLNATQSDPKVTEIPNRLKRLEPAEPDEILFEDPVFDTPNAAVILGVTVDRLIKWRERRQGPDYLRYEQNGPVRYEYSSLLAFKAAHRVRPSRQPNPGRRS
jgi:hypothetical protein